MSPAETPEPPPSHPPADPVATATERVTHVPSHKSYRRKYRKIMVRFESKMSESNKLYKEEQKLREMSARLKEQTDQLLQLLLDLNSCPQVPQRLRFDLSRAEAKPEPVKKDETATKDEKDVEEGHLALRKARYQLQTGEINAERYEGIKESIMKGSHFAPSTSYADLTKVAPKVVVSGRNEGDPATSDLSGFVTAKQEGDYIQHLDAYISGLAPTPRLQRMVNRDKEAQMQNPVSVYNWLKRNQPSVFAQDNDKDEKPSRTTGARSSKRNANRESIIKQEQDMYDDDGIALEPNQARGKRKRDDDGGYRPKGGNSRPAKRKKQDSISKGGKKLSIDAK